MAQKKKKAAGQAAGEKGVTIMEPHVKSIPQAAHDDKLLQFALQVHRSGRDPFFTLHIVKNGKKDVIPLEGWKHKLPDRMRTEAEIIEAWKKHPDANAIQIRLHDEVFIDFDTKEGLEEFKRICTQHKVTLPPDLATMKTTRGHQVPIRLDGYRPVFPKDKAGTFEILQAGNKPPMVYGPGREWNCGPAQWTERAPELDPGLYAALCECMAMVQGGRHPEKGIEKKALQIGVNIRKNALTYVNNSAFDLPAFNDLLRLGEFLNLDTSAWALGKSCRCLWPEHSNSGEDESPSASFYIGYDGKTVLYHDWHTGVTCTGAAALYCKAFGLEPGRKEWSKKRLQHFGLFLAGARGFLREIDKRGAGEVGRRAVQCRKAFDLMETDPEAQRALRRAALLAELYHHATGGDFALPVRHLAAFLETRNSNGNLDIHLANRVINTLCLMGYLRKTPELSIQGERADTFVFGEIDTEACMKLYPLTIEKVRKMSGDVGEKIIGTDAGKIWRKDGPGPERWKKKEEPRDSEFSETEPARVDPDPASAKNPDSVMPIADREDDDHGPPGRQPGDEDAEECALAEAYR